MILVPELRNSIVDGLRVNVFDDIKDEMRETVACRSVISDK